MEHSKSCVHSWLHMILAPPIPGLHIRKKLFSTLLPGQRYLENNAMSGIMIIAKRDEINKYQFEG